MTSKPSALRIYAVSTLVRTRDGRLEHALHILEASSLDAAEGRVLAHSLPEGRRLCGLLSNVCRFDAA